MFVDFVGDIHHFSSATRPVFLLLGDTSRSEPQRCHSDEGDLAEMSVLRSFMIFSWAVHGSGIFSGDFHGNLDDNWILMGF